MPDRLILTRHETSDFEEEVVVQEKLKLEKTDKIKMEKSEKSEKLPLFSDERILIIEKEIKQEDGDLSDKNDKSENRSENSEKYVERSEIKAYNEWICKVYLLILVFYFIGLTNPNIHIAMGKRMMTKF